MSEPVKVTSKERIAELQATVLFLTNARNTLISAGSVLKGENAKLHLALSITEKKLSNLKCQYDQDEKEFDGAINDLETKTTEIQELTKKLEASRYEVNRIANVSLSHFNVSQQYKKDYEKKHSSSVWAWIITYILAAPYISITFAWVIEHVRVCLH